MLFSCQNLRFHDVDLVSDRVSQSCRFAVMDLLICCHGFVDLLSWIC